MNNLFAPFNPYADPRGDSESISEEDNTSTWNSVSDDDSHDSDEGEVDSLSDEGCADEEYWEEDVAADTWLASFPGGTSLLYPQLFVVKPRGGKALTPSLYPSNVTLLKLPYEIRDRIYRYYFNRDEEARHPKERYAPFRDRKGTEMQRICLSSENVELKFWLSTALLQTSRQIRFEAMPILFSTRVITVEWLYALPRFIEFMGKEGCAMVRYLDIWDSLNFQGDHNDVYRNIITYIMHFPRLQHLRVVISWGVRPLQNSELWSDRTYSWFDRNEWKHNQVLTREAVPKMRSEDIEIYWPELEILKKLKAQKFTLAVETPWADRYLEFDRDYGPYPEISRSMQSHDVPLASLATSSISSQGLEALEAVQSQTYNRALNPDPELNGGDPDNPTWQETDHLTNKTIPLYNFLREFFHQILPVREMSEDKFVVFPTAQESTGSIIQDCAFCYFSERHCGYHAVPDQPPFERTRLESDSEDEDEEEDVMTLQARFKDLSYLEMRQVCQDIVQWIWRSDPMMDEKLPWGSGVTKFMDVVAIFKYQGWREVPNSERLARLDAVVETGWVGKGVDKDEVPPWDLLYREVHIRYK